MSQPMSIEDSLEAAKAAEAAGIAMDGGGLTAGGEVVQDRPGVIALGAQGPYKPNLGPFKPLATSLQRSRSGKPAAANEEVYASEDAARVAGGLYAYILDCIVQAASDPCTVVAAAAKETLQVTGLSWPVVTWLLASESANAHASASVRRGPASSFQGPRAASVSGSPGGSSTPPPRGRRGVMSHSSSSTPNHAAKDLESTLYQQRHSLPPGLPQHSSHHQQQQQQQQHVVSSLPHVHSHSHSYSFGESAQPSHRSFMAAMAEEHASMLPSDPPKSHLYARSSAYFSHPLLDQHPASSSGQACGTCVGGFGEEPAAPGAEQEGAGLEDVADMAAYAPAWTFSAETQLRVCRDARHARAQVASPEAQDQNRHMFAELQRRMQRAPAVQKVSELVGSLDVEASLPSVMRHHPLVPQLIIGDARGTVRVWDWKKNVVTNCFAGTGRPRDSHSHAPGVSEMALVNLCESHLLLVGGADGCVSIWRNYTHRSSGRLASTWRALPQTSKVLSTRYGAGGQPPCVAVYEWQQGSGRLYAAGDEMPVPLVHVWDAGTEQCINEINTQASAAVTCLSGGEYTSGMESALVGGTAHGGLFTFDQRTPSGLLYSSQCHSQRVVNAFRSLHAPNTVVSGSTAGDLKWWDVRRGISTPYRIVSAAKAAVSTLIAHPHLPLLACGSTDQAVEIFNIKEGDQLNLLKYQSTFLGQVGQRIPPVNCLDFHPFSTQLAVGSTDSTVVLYKGTYL